MTNIATEDLLDTDLNSMVRKVRQYAKAFPLRPELHGLRLSTADLTELRDRASRLRHESEPAYVVGVGFLSFSIALYALALNQLGTLFAAAISGISLMAALVLVAYYRLWLAGAHHRLRTCVEIYDDEIGLRRGCDARPLPRNDHRVRLRSQQQF